jgi:PII-like signaling protein
MGSIPSSTSSASLFSCQKFRSFRQTFPPCKFLKKPVLLRIFIGESDRWEGKPLAEAIVLKARELHLGGATVLRGPMGYGKTSRLHTAKILNLSTDLPLVIEIVDSEAAINAFLPVLDGMITGGLVTMEKVRVLHYRGKGRNSPSAVT